MLERTSLCACVRIYLPEGELLFLLYIRLPVSKAFVPIYTPSRNVPTFSFLLTCVRSVRHFHSPSLLGMKWYLIMAFIWISLITCEVEHHCMRICPLGLLLRCDLPVHLFGRRFLSCSFTFSLTWSSLWALDRNVNICYSSLWLTVSWWLLTPPGLKTLTRCLFILCLLLLVLKSFPTLRPWTDYPPFFSGRFKVRFFT